MNRLIACVVALALAPSPVLAAAAPKPAPVKGAPCPAAETVSIGRFGVHQDGIAGLPPDQRAAFKALAARLARSLDAGCTPISTVELTGHADRDRDRGPAFELDISKRRATAFRDGLVTELGAQKAARITFKVNGVGATQLKVGNPVNEAQRQQNRRVVVVTRLGKSQPPAPPKPPNQCVQPLISSVVSNRKGITPVSGPRVCIIPIKPFVVVKQRFNGETSRVLFPDVDDGRKLPLVIYLHGTVDTPPKSTPRNNPRAQIPSSQMMATLAEMQSDAKDFTWDFGLDMGALSHALIAGEVSEHIVAVPSETLANRNGGNLFRTFNLGQYVEDVDRDLRARGGPGVDLDNVIVAGWSGSGCFGGAGLLKIAEEKARFTAEDPDTKTQGGHELLVLGNADAGVDAGIGETLSGRLLEARKSKPNVKTVVYSVHKAQGGCSLKADGTGAVSREYFTKLGATRATRTAGTTNEDADLAVVDPKTKKPALIDFYQTDGRSPAKRVGARVTSAGLRAHVPEFIKARALVEDPNKHRIDHALVPLVWAFYALPRFLPAPKSP